MWGHQSFLTTASFMADSLLLNSSLFLFVWMCAHSFLDELELALVLEHLEQLHGVPIVGHEAAHLLDHVLHELGVLGEVPVLLAMHRLAAVLCHFGFC